MPVRRTHQHNQDLTRGGHVCKPYEFASILFVVVALFLVFHLVLDVCLKARRKDFGLLTSKVNSFGGTQRYPLVSHFDLLYIKLGSKVIMLIVSEKNVHVMRNAPGNCTKQQKNWQSKRKTLPLLLQCGQGRQP